MGESLTKRISSSINLHIVALDIFGTKDIFGHYKWKMYAKVKIGFLLLLPLAFSVLLLPPWKARGLVLNSFGNSSTTGPDRGTWDLPVGSSSCCSKGTQLYYHNTPGAHTNTCYNTSDRKTCRVCGTGSGYTFLCIVKGILVKSNIANRYILESYG
ncbi:hypothetical protein Lal_00040275 [Lupinus albus]|nr:hypothetical protein Lal_00040275 [Lupinus albus]